MYSTFVTGGLIQLNMYNRHVWAQRKQGRPRVRMLQNLNVNLSSSISFKKALGGVGGGGGGGEVGVIGSVQLARTSSLASVTIYDLYMLHKTSWFYMYLFCVF